MNHAIRAVRAEFGRWLDAECGTWRAWVMLWSYLLGPLVIIAVVRTCRHSA